ncbi:ribonuclease H family protein [Rhizobium metallidurans]|uniref:ribonuclease H n=1 Tax=Rhizobium metallidurans TaxID=1265931 RepID=A0A7W6GDD5_9HYPH|nr:ribonuclease H [Rhizobium metallidurans]MBB3966744.1 ribonuclease HI [Rhizobium metallidurans]
MTDSTDDPRSIDAHDRLEIFTDGCCEPGSRDGGWGFVVYRDGVEIASGCGGAAGTANNAMEATAVLKAAEWANIHAAEAKVTIWSDSVYAVKGCNEWRPIWRNNGFKKITANSRLRSRGIADADLWRAIDTALSGSATITVSWCKGHVGTEGNERADRLADSGRLSIAEKAPLRRSR